ncbi:MAG TPA: SHOCT domain-containing protein [Aquihabitans sp.]|nr:SHOCT domain-containing protein [Aquihabitans sp.]
MAGSVACLTLLFRSMRAVMGAGLSSCGSGGPYVVANPCPKGVGWMLPISIWVGLGFLALAAVAAHRLGRASIAWLAWPALFLSLGANFWQFGLDPVGADGPDWGWIVCAVLFTIMGGGPLLLVLAGRGSASGWTPSSSAPRAASRAAAAGARIRAEATPPPFRPTPGAGDDLVGSLERLASLHREGAIDDDEYADAKRRLLEGR